MCIRDRRKTERKRERQRETDRLRHRQTETQTDRQRQRHRQTEREITDLPDDVGRLQWVELDASVGDGADADLVVQVNLEETNDATFDVGTPRGLRGVERDLANGAHGPAERERSVDMLLTPPMVQRNRQTNGERERGGE